MKSVDNTMYKMVSIQWNFKNFAVQLKSCSIRTRKKNGFED